MSNTRRSFFSRFALGAGVFAAQHVHSPDAPVPVETPDVARLPFKMVDGAKEFHIVAEPVHTRFVPGREVDAWGYNGAVPGPTIEVNQGDRIRVIFENHLPEMTSIHWHGLEIPMAADGVPGLSQNPVMPGERFVYEFELHPKQTGTFFYHSHFPMQEMMGMLGLFVIHPREPQTPRVDRDFGLLIQEWALLPNNTVPNTLSMEFNWLTFNGRSGPDCTPMLARKGERVRIRLVNLGMDHHPIHLHGNTFVTTGTEAGRIPEAAWTPGNTVLVGVAQARDIEFRADYAGDWMLHCHMPHHMMNQMIPMVGPVAHPMAAMHHPGSAEFYPKDDPEKKKVPGYPQDMWMVMDEMFSKPENYGLRPGWTGGMMGMMTLIRVLEPELYDKIMALKAQAAPKEHVHE
jgi:FtsP/CotA-like multicopper oxidase with cupredoxin domain